jgi:hypothetical protein
MARQARELRKLKIILKILFAQPAQLNAALRPPFYRLTGLIIELVIFNA